MPSHLPRAALLAGLLAIPALLPAQRPAPAQRLDTVTVTATRAPVAAAALPQRVEVITRADLERAPLLDVADALKKLAGVDVIQFPGLLAGVGIRGFRPQYSGLSARTLVLVDGRPAGVTNLATLDLAAVERIEVLKGPASSLYGSSAMGGAVNVVTRRRLGAPGGRLAASYGSFQTSDLSVQAGGRLGGRWDGDVTLRRYQQGDDYRVGSGNVLRELVGGGTATRLESGGPAPVADLGDGSTRRFTRYHTGSGAARVGYGFDGGWRADARAELFRADDVESPGDIFFGDAQRGRKDVARHGAELAVSGERGRHRPLARVYAAREDVDYHDVHAPAPYVNFATTTTTRGVQLQDVIALGAHALTVGVDHGRAVAESRAWMAAGTGAAPYSPDAAVASVAAFAEGRWSAMGGRLTGTLGARLDRVSLEVRRTPLRPDLVPETDRFLSLNPSAGVQLHVRDGVRLHGSVGRAFVAPDPFYKAGLTRASPAAGVASFVAGNPALDAERSWTWDAGVALAHGAAGFDADVTYFRTVVDDRITLAEAVFPEAQRPRTPDGDAVARVTTAVNAAAARMHGLEARAAVDVGALAGWTRSLRLFANGTRLFSAEERVRAASVDAARFAGRTDFAAEDVVGAFVFGPAAISRIRNVAELTLGYGVEYDDGRRWTARLGGRYVGERLDSDFTDWMNVTDIVYPPFMVLDLSAGARLGERLRVDATLSNATDENYYEIRGYPLAGRAAGLRVTVDY